VGFKAVRVEASQILRQLLTLTFEITEGGNKGPNFRIVLELSRNPSFFSSSSCSSSSSPPSPAVAARATGAAAGTVEVGTVVKDEVAPAALPTVVAGAVIAGGAGGGGGGGRFVFHGRNARKAWGDALDKLCALEKEVMARRRARKRRRLLSRQEGGGKGNEEGMNEEEEEGMNVVECNDEEAALRRKVAKLYTERVLLEKEVAKERLHIFTRLEREATLEAYTWLNQKASTALALPVPPLRMRAPVPLPVRKKDKKIGRGEGKIEEDKPKEEEGVEEEEMEEEPVRPWVDYRSFFTESIRRLIEGMPGADKCALYEFVDLRSSRGEGDKEGGLAPPSDLVRAEDGVRALAAATLSLEKTPGKMAEAAAAVRATVAAAAAEEAAAADLAAASEGAGGDGRGGGDGGRGEMPQMSEEEEAVFRAFKEKEREDQIRAKCEEVRRKEEEKEVQRQSKLVEKEEKKRSKEEQRLERRMKQVEEKRKRDRVKELERELKRLRIRMDNDIQRRRAATRMLVQAIVEDPAGAGYPFIDHATGEPLLDDALLDDLDKPLPPPSLPPSSPSASSSSRLSPSNPLLSSRAMAGILHVWDFGYTFAGFLGMTEWPSLPLFLKALETAEACATRHPTPKEERRMRFLSELAQRLTGVLLPDLVQTLLYSPQPVAERGGGGGGGGGGDPDPTLPLNEMTWPELARWALIAQAYRVLQIPVDLPYALRGRGIDFQMDAWDKKALTMGRLRLLLKRGREAGRVAGGWSRTAFTLFVPTPNPLASAPSSWQAALEGLRFWVGGREGGRGREWVGTMVREQMDRALGALEGREAEVGVGVMSALKEARALLAPPPSRKQEEKGKEDETALHQAVEGALLALEMYQSNLLEGGVWKELETDPIAGSLQRGGQQQQQQEQQQQQQLDDEEDELLVPNGDGGEEGKRAGAVVAAVKGEEDEGENKEGAGATSPPPSLKREMTSESLVSLSAASASSTTGDMPPPPPSLPPSASSLGVDLQHSISRSTGSMDTDSVGSGSRRSSMGDGKKGGGKRGRNGKGNRLSLMEGEDGWEEEGEEEEEEGKEGEDEDNEDEDEDGDEDEEDEDDIDAYRDITPEDFEDKPEVVQRCYAILQALMHAKGGSQFKYQPHIEGYHDVVARPLGLMDVTRNLRNGMYDSSVGQFAADVRLVFVNCALFNAENDVIMHDADRLVARFDRLLLQWVLDGEAPPIGDLGLDTTCLVCRDPMPQSVEVELVGGIKEWRPVAPQQCNRCDACFHPDCVKMPIVHPNVRNASETGKEKEYWFCSDCVREKKAADIDPYLRLRVIKHFPGTGAYAGRVVSVRYTRETAIYSLLFRDPSLPSSFFEHTLTRPALRSLLLAQGLPQQNPELARLLLPRSPAIDPKCEFEALGHTKWGLGLLLEGEGRLPRKLDPEVSLVARRWVKGGDVEVLELLRGIRALDAGVGGRKGGRAGARKGGKEWVACLVALAGMCGGTGRMREYLEGHEQDLRGQIGQALIEGGEGGKEEGEEGGIGGEGGGGEKALVPVHRTEEKEEGEEDKEDQLSQYVPENLLPGAGGTARLVKEEEDVSDDEKYVRRQKEALLLKKKRGVGRRRGLRRRRKRRGAAGGDYGEETESEEEEDEDDDDDEEEDEDEIEIEDEDEAEDEAEDEEEQIVKRGRGRVRKSLEGEEADADAAATAAAAGADAATAFPPPLSKSSSSSEMDVADGKDAKVGGSSSGVEAKTNKGSYNKREPGILVGLDLLTEGGGDLLLLGKQPLRAREYQCFEQGVKQETKRALGREGIRLQRRLVRRGGGDGGEDDYGGNEDTQDEDGGEDEEEEEEEEEGGKEGGEEGKREVRCGMCGETEQYLCNVMVHGPTVEDYYKLPLDVRQKLEGVNSSCGSSSGSGGGGSSGGGREEGPDRAVLWRPVDDRLAAETEAALREVFATAPPGRVKREGGREGGREVPTMRKGSMIMHECCADALMEAKAAGEARVRKGERKEAVEGMAFTGRGRTTNLGQDRKGRFYWQLAGEPSLLFVQPWDRQGQLEGNEGGGEENVAKDEERGHGLEVDEEGGRERWVVYESAEAIGRVVEEYLDGRGKKERALREAILSRYPEVKRLVRRRRNEVGGECEEQQQPPQQEWWQEEEERKERERKEREAEAEEDKRHQWKEGESVFVRKRGVMWRATVICLNTDKGVVRVSYNGWTHADEWISCPSSEPSSSSPSSVNEDENERGARPTLLRWTSAREKEQEEKWEESQGVASARYTPPLPVVEKLKAFPYVTASNRNRPRSKGRFLPTRLKYEFRRKPLNAETGEQAEEEGLYDLKAAILTIEAALPLGCLVDVPEASRKSIKLRRDELPKWARRVETATTAGELMEALIMLEHSIDSRWRLNPFRGTYFLTMSSWAHAVKLASPSSLALRIYSLDRLLDYGRVELDTDGESRKLMKGKQQPPGSIKAGSVGGGYCGAGVVPDFLPYVQEVRERWVSPAEIAAATSATAVGGEEGGEEGMGEGGGGSAESSPGGGGGSTPAPRGRKRRSEGSAGGSEKKAWAKRRRRRP